MMKCASIVPPWNVWFCKVCDQNKRKTMKDVDEGWTSLDFEEEPTQPVIKIVCPKCGSNNTAGFMSKWHCWDCGAVF